MPAPMTGQAIRIRQKETNTSSWSFHFKFIDHPRSHDVLTLHGEGLMTASALLVHLHYQHLVGGNGELVKDKDGTLILLSATAVA